MIDEIRNNIISLLNGNFTSSQLKEIDLAVAKSLQGYTLTKEETMPVPCSNLLPLDVREFIARKQVKGCSKQTIRTYTFALNRFIQWAKKDLREMTDIDILIYLDYLMSNHKMSARTLEGNRLVLSSFYTFLQDSGKIVRNPMRSVDPIKYSSKVREPLSDIELERVRNACENEKERALIEVLYSTGARVSEIASMNWNDIDILNRHMIITGKGDKQRYVFFNAKSLYAIQKYMDTRTDNNTALFVKDCDPHSRLTKSGIEYIVKQIGIRADLSRPLYPHLFRHTFATDMLSNGAPINEVSRILGHESIETTLIYAKESIEDLSLSHKKHIA